MGHMSALSMIDAAGRNEALAWHLQHNHFPPVSLAFLPVAEQAIAAFDNEDPTLVLTLPNGRKLTAGRVVEGLHLTAFLSGDPWLEDVEDDDDE